MCLFFNPTPCHHHSPYIGSSRYHPYRLRMPGQSRACCRYSAKRMRNGCWVRMKLFCWVLKNYCSLRMKIFCLLQKRKLCCPFLTQKREMRFPSPALPQMMFRSWPCQPTFPFARLPVPHPYLPKDIPACSRLCTTETIGRSVGMLDISYQNSLIRK